MSHLVYSVHQNTFVTMKDAIDYVVDELKPRNKVRVRVLASSMMDGVFNHHVATLAVSRDGSVSVPPYEFDVSPYRASVKRFKGTSKKTAKTKRYERKHEICADCGASIPDVSACGLCGSSRRVVGGVPSWVRAKGYRFRN